MPSCDSRPGGCPARRGQARLRLALAAAAACASLAAAANAQPVPRPPATETAARPAFTLVQLTELALRENPALAVARADERTASAGIVTARAYPNPELALESGQSSGRSGAPSGASTVYSIGQPIENPWLRDARARLAQTRLDLAGVQAGALRSVLVANLRNRFFDVVRLRDEVQASAEDLQLTEQIRERVAVRVRVGEGARFDLIRAESEVAVSRKNLESARLRLRQATLELKRAATPTLPDDFDVAVEPSDMRALADSDYHALKYAVVERNPEVIVARQEVQRAEDALALERNSIWPQVTLRAMQEREPSATLTRIGAAVTVPLLNRREGPIAEAQAQAERAKLALEQRRFDADAAFETAWQAYRAATAQVQSLEGGILERARTVVDIAEAAYRFGERGILEFLDAQRQYRLVRNELITARFQQQSARSELERLAGR